jgi:hypothetical protein
MDLAETYPKLSKYITSDEGRLTIAEEGWTELENSLSTKILT